VVGLALISGLAYFYFRRHPGVQPASSAFKSTAYTPAPNNPDLAPNMSYNPDPNSLYMTSQPQVPYVCLIFFSLTFSALSDGFQDPPAPSAFPTTSAPAPSSPYANTYSPPPASTTYTSFQSSTPQVAQPYIPTSAPATTGHYTGAPEV
jgi:hypothetical protein